jgi:hypothetical protein
MKGLLQLHASGTLEAKVLNTEGDTFSTKVTELTSILVQGVRIISHELPLVFGQHGLSEMSGGMPPRPRPLV